MVKAFLIGAGATRAEYKEAPLSDDFFSILKSRKSYMSPRHDQLASVLYSAIEKTIQPHIDTPLHDSNIEGVMKHSSTFTKPVEIKFRESLDIAIYELLAKPTESDKEYFSDYLRGAVRRPATTFKALLKDPRLSKSDFFMTLNYDLYLDREILSVHRNIDYGLEPRFINRTVDFHKLTTDQYYSLYHLHGALNWENSPNDRINIHLGAVLPNHALDPNICIAPPGVKNLNPVLASIWTIAERRLMDADELIIIGCSLNPEDIELIDLLKKFVEKKGVGYVKIIHNNGSTDSGYHKNYQNAVIEYFDFPHGFDVNGPENDPENNAIDFIFKEYPKPSN